MSSSPEPEAAPDGATRAGRRRAASRHRSSWSGPLPGWAPWLLRRGLPLVSLVPALLATLFVQASAPPPVPLGAARFAFAGADLAPQPGALDGYRHALSTPVLAWLGYGWLERALLGGSAQPVAAAVRGALLVLALASVALLWLVARRLGRSGLAAGAAATVLGIAPIAVAVHGVPAGADLAVPALLGAGLVLTVRRLSVLAGAAAGVLAGTAVVLEPAALAAVPVLAVPFAVGARGGHALARAIAAVAALLAVAVLGALELVALAGRTPRGSAAAELDLLGAAAARPAPAVGGASGALWLATDPLALLVGAVAIVVAATLPRGRLIAATAALLVAVSVWPLGREPLAVPVLVLPVVALAVALVVDRSVVALGSPTFLVSLVGSGWLMGVAALLVVAIVVSAAAAQPPARAAPPAAEQAAAWVRANVPPNRVVLVDVAAWPDTVRGTRARVGWYAPPASRGTVPSSLPWSTADYVLAGTALRRTAAGTAAAELRDSVLLLTFGSGSGAVQLRAREDAGRGARPPGSGNASPSPGATSGPDASSAPPAGAAQARRAATARRTTGGELARNPRIVLDATDRALLVGGAVDTRIILALGQLASQHAVTVAGFPAVPGDAGGVRRRVLIGALDGVPVPGDAARTGVLLRYLSGLQPPYAPALLDAKDTGVLVTFAADPTFVPSL